MWLVGHCPVANLLGNQYLLYRFNRSLKFFLLVPVLISYETSVEFEAFTTGPNTSGKVREMRRKRSRPEYTKNVEEKAQRLHIRGNECDEAVTVASSQKSRARDGRLQMLNACLIDLVQGPSYLRRAVE